MSAGSETFVWIKLATAKEDAFAKIFAAPGSDVAGAAKARRLGCASCRGLLGGFFRIQISGRPPPLVAVNLNF